MTDQVFNKRIAIILIITLLVGSITSGFAHIYLFHFTIIQWLLVNMCAPSSIAVSIGLIIYLFKRKKNIGYFLVACCDFLFAFSIMGMFIPFAWRLEFIQVQIMHFIMIFTGIYVLYFVYKDIAEKDVRYLLLRGVLPGLIALSFIILIVYPIFFTANPGIFDKYIYHF